MSRLVTQVIIVAVIVAVSGWTLAMSRNATPGDTVSETMRRWARRWWVIPPAWAALFGHWFGPVVSAAWPRWTGWVLVALGALGLGANVWGRWRIKAWPVWWILGALGAVAGAALWPLERGA